MSPESAVTAQDCPVAQTLQLIGQWWTVLIVRDALRGVTRFDQFRRSLDISPAILAKRLQALVDAGLMQRRRYNDHPPRDEYLLTEAGLALGPVVRALREWGLTYGALTKPCGDAPESRTTHTS